MIQFLDGSQGNPSSSEFWMMPYKTDQNHPFIRIRPHEYGDLNTEELEDLAGSDLWEGLFDVVQPETGKADYTDAVRRARDIFEQGKMEKIMLSRTTFEPLPAGFRPLSYLADLRKRYPNAFISLISTPYSGTWIGATPEKLVEKKGNRISTISLAGTRQNNENTGWTAKEYHEQELVTKYIREVFAGSGTTDPEVTGPYDYEIGHLVHLRTDFSAVYPESPDKTKFMELLMQLHPTPAVGGYPKAALDIYLPGLEAHHRRYYAGFIGMVTPDLDAALFVNLRCMYLTRGRCCVITGAGITPGSDPEAEWEETSSKSQILINPLRQYH